MKTRVIDGLQFKNALENGLNVLANEENEVNALNVFPVADGDTGTNMRLTLEHGLAAAPETPAVGAFLKGLSDGMLLGARGNSGVILSQIFRGIFQELQHAGRISSVDLRNALIRGYKTAYNAVIRPAEGTVLTVSREGIENIRNQITRLTTIDELLGMYLAEMNKSLANTTELLPELKAASVVDSGAKGYIAIVEGMLKYFFGETVTRLSQGDAKELPTDDVDETVFNEKSEFRDGYCCEFVLQLMKTANYTSRFREKVFLEDLRNLGSSIVCARSGSRVKVHIHSMKPGKILTIAQEYGEFISLKIENMQIQHNVTDMKKKQKKAAIHKSMATVAVANGDGFRKLFEDLGLDVCLDGGATMNTSSEDFVDAFRSLDADRILVFPNNKNIEMAAEQAKGLCTDLKVDVIPTFSQMECFAAMQMDIPDSDDSESRIQSVLRGKDRLKGMYITRASRHYVSDGISCEEGEFIAVSGGSVLASGENPEEAFRKALEKSEELREAETVILFTGEGKTDEDAEQLEEILAELCPMADVTVLAGGQPVFDFEVGFIE